MGLFRVKARFFAVPAVALLAACGSQPLPAGSIEANPALATRAARDAGSWMRAGAKKSSLLYVSDGSGSVFVYTYPQLKLTGTLKGFSQPLGECVTKSGNVWIANFGAQELDEYAHGGTKAIAKLKTDTYHSPYGCSVNAKTGDLAVTTWRGGSGPGYVSIYKQAKGTPKTYSDSAFVYTFYPGYDDKGNVFVDGVAAGSAFKYAELPSGKTKFAAIKLKKSIGYPGNVQFDGKYVTVGDQTARAVYRTSGAKVVGTTNLDGTGTLYGTWIAGGVIIGADDNGIEVFKYPAGGAATGSVYVAHPSSVVMSTN